MCYLGLETVCKITAEPTMHGRLHPETTQVRYKSSRQARQDPHSFLQPFFNNNNNHNHKRHSPDPLDRHFQSFIGIAL